MAAAGRQQGQEDLEELRDQMGQLDLQEEEEEVPVLDLQAARQHAVDLTLDPGTAHPKLILSDDRKQVSCGDERQSLQDGPRRFNHCLNVLAEQGFSEGRFYFEVQVRGKTGWTIGVIRKFINRKGVVKVSPSHGVWAMRLRNKNQYKAQADPPVLLSLNPPPEKVGVFVDYEQRLISFYNADTGALICSITDCVFTEELYPFFSPGPYKERNSAALVITAVRE